MAEAAERMGTGLEDTSLSAVILAQRPLRYLEGPSPEHDRPAHVRAGSALAWVDRALVVIQDDALFLGVVDLASGEVRAQALPRGKNGARLFDERRGNKKDKLDFEACVSLERSGEPGLLLFGSGSRPERQRIGWVPRTAIARANSGALGERASKSDVDFVNADALYEHFRAEVRFSGAELNIEGVARVDEDTLRLFQRGNGQATGALPAVDATGDLCLSELLAYLHAPQTQAPPRLHNVHPYTLGALDGVRLTFTDAVSVGAGRVLFAAAAEASPDVYSDGEVQGSVVGIIGTDGVARWTPLRHRDGSLARLKAEGLAVDPANPNRLWVVLDMDDVDVPCALCDVSLGPGFGLG